MFGAIRIFTELIGLYGSKVDLLGDLLGTPQKYFY